MRATVRFRLLASGVLASVVVAGCAPIKVLPLAAAHRIEHVCIHANRSVHVPDFLPVMQEGFEINGITSEIVTGATPSHCLYTVNYTARRSWNMRVYLSQAQIDIQRDGQVIASAIYNLKGTQTSGLDEYADTRTKILPVMNTLLGKAALRKHTIITRVESPLPTPRMDTWPASTADLPTKLSELKEALDTGLVSQQEYEQKRQALLDAH